MTSWLKAYALTKLHVQAVSGIPFLGKLFRKVAFVEEENCPGKESPLPKGVRK